MEGKKLFVIVIAILIFGIAYAHEELLPQGFDIHLTPQQAFQDNEISIEAKVTKNNAAAESLSVDFVIDKHDIGLSERIEAKEREPGHYTIKYNFKNAGPHEIHVEFSHESEEIRKTFDINVTGRAAETEQYFLIAAIFVLALSVLHGLMSKKFKRPAIFALILLAVIGLAYSVYVVYASGAAQRGVFVCVSGNECYWTAHIHAEVDVNICGQEYRFPIEKGRLDGPHTHEEKNLIHFHERLRIDPITKEILNPQPLTLGAFFDAMEVRFDTNRILDRTGGNLCNGQPGMVKMFVNGKASSDFRDYIWKDGDKIKIIFDERPAEAVEKEEQKATALLTPELTLPIIIGFALVDSINPCVIGVLLLLITILLRTKKKKLILRNGSAYIAGVYITYLIGGVTLLSIFNAVREIQLLSQLFYIVIGAVILFAAFLEIKDYFWYGRGLSLAIPSRFVKTIETSAGKSRSLIKALLFGSLVTLIELPCTGAPYLAIITMMSQSGIQFLTALMLLLLYNIVFILPLIVIIYLAYKGVSYKKIEFWRREHKGRMRLAVGLMLLGVSIWIITTIMEWLLPYLAIGSALAIIIMFIVWKRGR